ncbi:3-hydroxybutyryl-CoA dehydrogenase [Bacillus sp. FJAT-27225]|uniref:3-hydroxyacyl-CoA dehydrogenase family protein n=1 Tax=Bacillus sp. FJAT-27225 TaxID=1743144 RepID=UPI00080C249C|nr:3-hydroxyacyl-CoA dehydrogenase family protein [Bacillus sp. FJAT-27225]OCA81594.1 3-hydroxybutyryl-CoA dehydrogenase [Bacillus sp. FJAT-27225]
MIKNVTVIGSGVMGHGIAQVYALAGYPVKMYDIKEEFLQKAMELVKANLSLLIQENVITDQEKSAALERINPTTDLEEAVRDADFITEAIPEIIELKWELFSNLEKFAKPEAIIASNTSTFPISRLIEKASTPERMLITHFFNPAQLVPLVEIVKHDNVSEETVQLTKDLMTNIGKTPVVLNKDVPGFIANRLQAAIVREAFYLLKEGVADARDIDTVITAGPGFRWAFIGPIETADFGGLDTWKRVVENLAPVLDDSKGAPAVIEELYAQGKLGTKTGEGIYKYDNVSVGDKIRERDENFIRLAKIKNNQE